MDARRLVLLAPDVEALELVREGGPPCRIDLDSDIDDDALLRPDASRLPCGDRERCLILWKFAVFVVSSIDADRLGIGERVRLLGARFGGMDWVKLRVLAR